MIADHFNAPSIWYLLCNYFFILSTFIQKSVKNAEIRSFIPASYGNLYNETNVLSFCFWKSKKIAHILWSFLWFFSYKSRTFCTSFPLFHERNTFNLVLSVVYSYSMQPKSIFDNIFHFNASNFLKNNMNFTSDFSSKNLPNIHHVALNQL